MESHVKLQADVPASAAFRRLDQIAAELFPEYSRSRIQSWIKSGQLLVDGRKQRASGKLMGGECLQIEAELEDTTVAPEPVELDIVFEDKHLLIINKQAGLVVHPGAGNLSGTLMNGLLYHDLTLGVVPRAGIVHRLDRGTTGLMAVAKTLASQTSLVAQLQNRSMQRVYMAVVSGKPKSSGKVEAPVGRHRYHRTKMTVREDGKDAVSHYRVLVRFQAHSLLEVSLETGRTHQIRVHMHHLGHPLVGDTAYGGRPWPLPADTGQSQGSFNRPALHAKKLALTHPVSGLEMNWEVSPPEDLKNLIDALKAHAEHVND